MTYGEGTPATGQAALPDVRATLCGIALKNPVIPASGTIGFGREMAEWYDLDILGGIALKGTTRQARFGNPTPRIAECTGGLLNAVGLQNPGVHAVLQQELPSLRHLYHGAVIANISGFSVDEYVYVAKSMDESEDVDLLEVNISCPNVRHGGMAFGQSCQAAAEVTAAVKKHTQKPVLMKLSPNVTDIAAIAAACEEAGADGLVVANTLLGMRIHPRTGHSLVSIGACGFSGAAVKPIILRMVYEVCRAVRIPVVGVGGIQNADDVLEYISAGAAAVQVGSANLTDPYACKTIVETLPLRMREYGLNSLAQARGRAHVRNGEFGVY